MADKNLFSESPGGTRNFSVPSDFLSPVLLHGHGYYVCRYRVRTCATDAKVFQRVKIMVLLFRPGGIELSSHRRRFQLVLCQLRFLSESASDPPLPVLSPLSSSPTSLNVQKTTASIKKNTTKKQKDLQQKNKKICKIKQRCTYIPFYHLQPPIRLIPLISAQTPRRFKTTRLKEPIATPIIHV